jgi:LruC domain-containing protein
MNIFYKILSGIALILLLTQCQKDNIEDNNEFSNNSLENIQFPKNFTFSTQKVVEINLKAPDVLTGSVFEIWYRNHQDEKLFLLKGTFNKQGLYLMKVSIPAIADTLYVNSLTFGMEREVVLPVVQGKVTYDYNIHFNAPRETAWIIEPLLKSATTNEFSYMGSYNANGYPGYLYQVNDHSWRSLINNLQQTLPEGISVPLTKPHFFEAGKQTNLILKERTRVFVTFAGEGTNQQNSLGYYIYNGAKPTGLQHTIIFPNASAPGSGGSLHSGDKVLLGEFEANTVIGWFLVPNGWNRQERKVTNVQGLYYSVPSYNGEDESPLNQYMIMMKDIENEVIVLGFEDTPRTSPECDHDFNDVVFYITLDRLEAADLSNMNNTISPVDTDGDGIIDSLDDYPLDPTKAFKNGGGTGSSGTIAFEDLWPHKGDYDFNDLVIDYQFSTSTDANNLVKSISAGINIRHVGGSFRNGFGIELPVAAALVESVTGTRHARNYLTIAPNGVEQGMTNAIIFPFDDGWAVAGQHLNITITFTDPVSPSILGSYPYNPFIVVNGERGREVHLPDYPPTAGANPAFFGQGADSSRPDLGIYYRSSTNLPWAIIVSENYVIPKEKNAINLGYLKFVDWAKSAGINYPDWYLDLAGYRNTSYLQN